MTFTDYIKLCNFPNQCCFSWISISIFFNVYIENQKIFCPCIDVSSILSKVHCFLKSARWHCFLFAVKKILGFPLTSQTISKIKDNAASSLVCWLFTLVQIFTLKVISAENDNFRKWKFWNTIQERFLFRRKFMFQSIDIQLFTF